MDAAQLYTVHLHGSVTCPTGMKIYTAVLLKGIQLQISQ